MINKLIIPLLLILLALAVSGCTQQTGPQPERNRELQDNEMQFVSFQWEENWDWNEICKGCQKGEYSCSTSNYRGKIHFTIFEDSEEVGLSCKYTKNGKTCPERKNEYRPIEKFLTQNGDYDISKNFGNMYVNKDNELTICCGIYEVEGYTQETFSPYQVCKTRTKPLPV